MNLALRQEVDVRLIVRSGAKRFAVPASSVREIASMPRLTHVPLAPPALLGLGSVRGETLAILSLSELVDPGGGEDPGEARQLLVLDGGLRAALAISRIERLDRSVRKRAVRTRSKGAITVPPLDDLIASVIPPRAASHRTAAVVPVTSASQPDGDRLALLRFTLGPQSFALPLENIAEVVQVPASISTLPGADETVVGSMPWRDTTLGILSLAALLGLPPAKTKANSASRIIIVGIGNQRFGLLVERVETVTRAAHDRIDPVPPSLLRTDGEARISAIYRPADGQPLVSILAADQLLSEVRTRKLLAIADRHREIATTLSSGRKASVPLLQVWMGNAHLAFPLVAIRQVVPRPAAFTRIPGTPEWLTGIAMIDGVPLPVVDQVRRLTGAPAVGTQQRLLAVEAGDVRVGFLVSRVGRIVHSDPAAFMAAPLPEALAEGIFGDALQVGQDDDAPLLLIDPKALISSAERAVIGRATLSPHDGTA